MTSPNPRGLAVARAHASARGPPSWPGAKGAAGCARAAAGGPRRWQRELPRWLWRQRRRRQRRRRRQLRGPRAGPRLREHQARGLRHDGEGGAWRVPHDGGGDGRVRGWEVGRPGRVVVAIGHHQGRAHDRQDRGAERHRRVRWRAPCSAGVRAGRGKARIRGGPVGAAAVAVAVTGAAGRAADGGEVLHVGVVELAGEAKGARAVAQEVSTLLREGGARRAARARSTCALHCAMHVLGCGTGEGVPPLRPTRGPDIGCSRVVRS
jgi:hypothetical protein